MGLCKSIKLTLHALVGVKPIAREDAALHIVAFRIPVIHVRRSQVPTILGVLYEAATQRQNDPIVEKPFVVASYVR
jgi:hypothetical protein